jgi:hypothetical protein
MANFSGLPVTANLDTTSRETTATVPLGTRCSDASGNEYTYVKAGAAIDAKTACMFNGSTLGYDDVREVTSASASRFVVGVATAAFASGDYGFLQTKGICTCLVTASTAVGSPLTTGTAADGVLDLAVAGTLAGIKPIVALTTGTTTATAGAVVYLG